MLIASNHSQVYAQVATQKDFDLFKETLIYSNQRFPKNTGLAGSPVNDTMIRSGTRQGLLQSGQPLTEPMTRPVVKYFWTKG